MASLLPAVFRGYVMLGQEQLQLFIPSEKVTPEVEDHLNTQHCSSDFCVKILDYQAIKDSLMALEDEPSVSSVLINPSTLSYALYNAVSTYRLKSFMTSSFILEIMMRRFLNLVNLASVILNLIIILKEHLIESLIS
ncbi:hypothetical protein E2C01_070373 [Portunus trituberculatus]|uniref:Uncharacterized protein n=1 Tax=Portunus trituberculatus TaxID=210409 RepID=A0A5B7HX45_PORTR|nr:hypothetical protein [Portunus trituberculatus]